MTKPPRDRAEIMKEASGWNSLPANQGLTPDGIHATWVAQCVLANQSLILECLLDIRELLQQLQGSHLKL